MPVSRLLARMDEAGVDRCVIIPMVPPGDDQMANNAAALAARMSQPARLAVVAPFDVGRPERSPLLKTWRSTDGDARDKAGVSP